jgi:ABC-type protease/lipase transport system fused ATPase/permease subunit
VNATSALLADPGVLVLDEPTAHLDAVLHLGGGAVPAAPAAPRRREPVAVAP